jgi:hypothetical protein
MKKALISPNEHVDIDDEHIGYRVAEVTNGEFEVASPLFWIDCPDGCLADIWYYNTESKECLIKPNNEPTIG